MLFGQWQIGATIMLYNPKPAFDAAAHLKLIGEHNVTTFCAPPTIYRTFAQEDLGAYDLSSLRHSFSAGEPLNPEVIKIWKDATGTTVHDGYGQTETINVVANVPGVAVRPGSMGLPVPGLDVDIVDDAGKRLPDGEVGHIAIRLTEPWPPGLFHGYYEDDEANERCFQNGWYYTGDTATRDADGYIWFVGRADDLIGSAGYRISPFEVESALIEHPAVAESAVVGKKDAMRGEIVKAYVVLAKGHEPGEAMIKELQDFVKSNTAPYKYPREIEFRDELPKTVSGKIRRVELRAEANG
jgi:acetyl-CoA synthetase